MQAVIATIHPPIIMVNNTTHLDLAVIHRPGWGDWRWPKVLSTLCKSKCCPWVAAAASVCRALFCLQISLFDSASSGCLDSQWISQCLIAAHPRPIWYLSHPDVSGLTIRIAIVRLQHLPLQPLLASFLPAPAPHFIIASNPLHRLGCCYLSPARV